MQVTQSKPQFSLLLYYKFTHLEILETFKKAHQRFCVANGIKGRVILAAEGVNGTVSGANESIEAYKKFIENMSAFHGIEWKQESVKQIVFAKMKTKVRSTILNMGIEKDFNVPQNTAKYLEPQEWKKVLDTEKDFLLFDIRNDYESKVGHFKGAILPQIQNFHEFPRLADEMESMKDKKILMYCTGGIRCEKFSSLLTERGFQNVYQLHGGIVRYGKETNGEHFEGSCFVFDDRMTVPISQNAKPISNCEYCDKPEDHVLNCANMKCNRMIICCDDCAHARSGACSEECLKTPGIRPFNPETFRIPFRKKGIVCPEYGIAKT